MKPFLANKISISPENSARLGRWTLQVNLSTFSFCSGILVPVTPLLPPSRRQGEPFTQEKVLFSSYSLIIASIFFRGGQWTRSCSIPFFLLEVKKLECEKAPRPLGHWFQIFQVVSLFLWMGYKFVDWECQHWTGTLKCLYMWVESSQSNTLGAVRVCATQQRFGYLSHVDYKVSQMYILTNYIWIINLTSPFFKVFKHCMVLSLEIWPSLTTSSNLFWDVFICLQLQSILFYLFFSKLFLEICLSTS